MRTFASLLMALLLSFGINSTTFAQEDEWGDSTEDSGDKGDKGDKGDDKGDAKEGGSEGGSGSDDPWEAPPEGDASADEPKAEVVIPSSYPVNEIGRPMTLPRLTLEPQLYFDIFIVNNADNWFTMYLGAGFGITDDLEAGLELPISFAPDAYAGLGLYGMYELGPYVSHQLFLAARLRMNIPFSKNFFVYFPGQSFFMLADVPVKLGI